jgi:hypothetical protein
MIYDELEPYITIEPQYPINIRQAFEPNWDPGFDAHPMLSINKVMDVDIASRYYNADDTAQPGFIPEKTTFRIWSKQSRLMQMHMDAFFNKNNNLFGVRHVEYIFDRYDGDHDEVLERLSRFPNMKTVKVVLRYRAGIFELVQRKLFEKYLERLLRLSSDVSTWAMPSWYTGVQLSSIQWEIEEVFLRAKSDGSE